MVEHLVNIGRRSALVRTAHFLVELGLRLQLAGLGSQTGYACPLNQYLLADALGPQRDPRQPYPAPAARARAAHLPRGRVDIQDLPRLRQLAGHHSGYLDQDNGVS